MVLVIISLFLLTSCWSNHELEESAIVHGVGLDKSEDKIVASVEIIKPGGEQEDDDEASSVDNSEHIVLEETTDTLLEGARELIQYTKKRLDFGHTEAWIISEELARDDVIFPLDLIRRDQMLRLNGNLFISKDDPIDILNTPTLYKHLVASELSGSMYQTKFAAEYAPITLRELYKLVEGPVSNAYIPLIDITENNKQKVTSVEGVAVINEKKMVGELDYGETAGLNLLLDQVKGGAIEVKLNEKEKVSIEIKKAKTKTVPKLSDNKLDVTIQTKITGTLADNITTDNINEKYFKKIEQHLEEHTKDTIQSTLDKLQLDFETDITNIGLETYRNYPKKWQHISSDWNEIFSNANIEVDVEVDITHQGLINNNKLQRNKPHNNPYLFFK